MEQINKFIKIDQNNAAVLNRLKVFKLIIERDNIKRIEISDSTHLQTSTLTYIIQDLKNFNLIKESILEDKTKNKGVKPNVITLNEEDNFVMGFDVKPKEILLVVKNLADKILFKKQYKILFKKDTIVNEISKIYSATLRKINNKKILGVGLGVPGVVDKAKNEIHVSSLLKVKNFPLGELLVKRLKTLVCVENNANAASYGEYILKYKNVTENLFLLLFHLNGIKKIKDIGIGSGLIINRDNYYGDFFAAGEMGDIFDDILKDMSNKPNSKFFSESLMSFLNETSEDNNSKHSQLLIKLGNRIGETISNIINIINPSIVVITGDSAIEQTKFFKSIKEGIKNNLVSFIRDKIQIEKSDFKEYNVSIGAACIVTKNILSYEYFNDLLSGKK